MTTADRGGLQIPPHIELSGYGLCLREWTDDDLPVMVDLFDESQISRWTPLSSPFDPLAAAAYLAKTRERRAEGSAFHLAITSDGRIAQGEILLFKAGEEPDVGELGYTTGARYRRQGLARRAVTLTAEYAFRSLGMRRLLLRIDPENTASVAVANSAGFQRTEDPPVVRDGKNGPVTLLSWARERP